MATGQSDQLEETITKIVADSLNEAKICSLQIPEFAEFIITYNWKPRTIVLDYEILGEPCSLKNLDEVMTVWIQNFLEKLESWVHIYEENFVSLTIEINDKIVSFFFDFRGKLTRKEELLKWIASSSSDTSNVRMISYYCETEECSIEFKLEK
jgi:stage 0 sporulation protein B (sporulation initiation phosphotransferase)